MKKIIVFAFIILLTGTLNADELQKTRQEIANELIKIHFMGGDHLHYADEILNYLQKVHNTDPIINNKPYKYSNYHHIYRNRRSRRTIDPYSLLSGGLAIHESLQIDSIVPSSDIANDVKISGLSGPEIESHPFNKMMAGRTHRMSSLARYCPEDFYYFHFSNMSKALEFFDYVGDVGGAIYKRYSPVSVDYVLKRKILTQLALKDNPAARKFYDHVIDEMTITGSDPFIKEGTDISLVFRVKIPAVFNRTVKSYRTYFKDKYRAGLRSVTIAGCKADYLYTRDRKIHSYMIFLDDRTVIISNCKEAAKRILLTQKNKYNSLADAWDFKYMRSIYPAGEKEEDAFLYLSDSFIRYLVGPELRIKEARRMYDAVRMAKLEKYIIYHYQLHKKLPSSMKDILDLFPEPDPSAKKEDKKSRPVNYHSDATKALKGLHVIQNSFFAGSDLYGKRGHMRSNLEYSLDLVSKKEAENYNRFKKRYNNFWKEFFDPIGIRIKLKEGIKVDTCILPLINNSMYNKLASFIGGTPVVLRSNNTIKGEIFNFNVKLNLAGKSKSKDSPRFDSFLKSDPFLRHALGTTSLLDLITGEIQFHMLDTAPLVDFDSRLLFSELMRGRPKLSNLYIGAFAWSFYHPVRMSLPLKSSLASEKIGTILKKYLQMRQNNSGRKVEIQTYSYTYKKHKVTVAVISFFKTLKFRIYFALRNNCLEIASTKQYIEKILEDSRPEAAPVRNRSNIRAAFRPGQIRLERDMYTFNFLESAQQASFKNFGTIKLLDLLFPGQKDLPAKSLEKFGFKPVCPAGGTYTIDHKGAVSNSVFGDYSSPVIEPEMIESPSLDRYFGTEEIKIELEFTPEGIKTRLTTK